LILNNELKSITKEAIVSDIERLSHLPEGTRFKHRKSEVTVLKVPGNFETVKSLPTDRKSEAL
jgi:hypothetical protein